MSGRVASDKFWIDFTNAGAAGAHFYVSANAFRTDGPWRYTVGAGASVSDYWAAGTPTGAYDLTVNGPNGFVRRFAGNRVTATTSGKANPEVTLRYAPADNLVWLKMTNSGTAACTITIQPNNRSGGPWTYQLAAGASTEDWFSTGNGANGWYDLTATANTTDGFVRRFAGHLENGAPSTSDPVMGSGRLPATVRSVDSQETIGETAPATRAVDGNPATFWHTRWTSPADPLPHELQLDLGTTRTVTGLTYLPRQDGSANGRIGQYELYLSTDGTTWGNPTTTGTFPDTATSKTIRCWPTPARYLRLKALTEAGPEAPGPPPPRSLPSAGKPQPAEHCFSSADRLITRQRTNIATVAPGWLRRSAAEQPGEEAGPALGLRMTLAPLVVGDGEFYLGYVLAAAGPGCFAALTALHRTTHFGLRPLGNRVSVPT